MKTTESSPWPMVRWLCVVVVYGFTIAIAIDQVKVAKDEGRAARIKLEEIRAEMRKVDRQSERRISELELEKTDWMEKAVNLANSSQKLIEAQGKVDSLRALAATTRNQVRTESIESNPPGAISVERELTDEEKLQSYKNSGISGVPVNISSEIIRKASMEKYAFSAVSEIESEAKGYFDVIEFEKPGTKLPLDVRNSISATARRKHPNDWSRTADEIKEQTEAWGTIRQWSISGVPGLTKIQSDAAIQEAKLAYPDDWHMMIYRVDAEAKKSLK